MRTVLLFIILLYTKVFTAQSIQWALQEHYSAQNQSQSVGTDKWGNIYITGRFIPSYNNFGGSTTGAVISKYASNGQLLWTDTVLNVREIRSVVDSTGNIFATGYFSNNAIFGNTTLFASGNNGGFLVKYSANGQCIFAKNYWGFGITLTTSGGIYTTCGKLTEGNPPYTVLNKYDLNGNPLWYKTIVIKNPTGLGYLIANSVSKDKDDNAFITGQFKDTVIFGTGSNAVTIIYDGPFYNNFIAKYDSAGTFQWVRTPTAITWGFESQSPFYVSSDSLGNSIIVGTFISNLTIGSNTYSSGNNASLILAKYNTSGNLLWDKAVIGSGTYHTNEGHNITQNKQSDFFITGLWRGTTDFGNGVVLDSICPGGAFVCKFDKSGIAQWVAHASSGSSIGYGVCADDNSNVYMVGQTSGSNTAFGTTTLSTPQYPDMFLAQIKDIQVNTGLNLNNAFKNEDLFLFYPNPTTGFLNISSNKYATGKTEIIINNVIGQCIFSKSYKISGAELNEQIDLSAYPKGIYFIEVSSEKGKEVKKIILE